MYNFLISLWDLRLSVANRSPSLLLMDLSVGLVRCKSFIFLIATYCGNAGWWCGAVPPLPLLVWLQSVRACDVQTQQGSLVPYLAAFLCLEVLLITTWTLRLSALSFFSFFDKMDIENSCCAKVSSLLQEENNSLSNNILWNCFIHSFILKPNVSRILLFLSKWFWYVSINAFKKMSALRNIFPSVLSVKLCSHFWLRPSQYLAVHMYTYDFSLVLLCTKPGYHRLDSHSFVVSSFLIIFGVLSVVLRLFRFQVPLVRCISLYQALLSK